LGGAFGTYRGQGEVLTGFWWPDPREGDNLKDLCVDGRIILKWIIKKWGGDSRPGFLGFRIGIFGKQL